MVEHFGALALFAVAGPAFLRGLVALARQLAHLFLALAKLAAAVAVGLVLTGRRPVGDLPDGLDRRGDDRLDRADASGEQGAVSAAMMMARMVFSLADGASSHSRGSGEQQIAMDGVPPRFRPLSQL